MNSLRHRLSDSRRHKRFRDKHKVLGLCHDCSRPVLNGMSLCIVHYAKHIVRCRKYKETHREEYALRNAEQRKQALLNHLCYKCLSPLIEDEGKYCFACQSGTHKKGGVLHYATIN